MSASAPGPQIARSRWFTRGRWSSAHPLAISAQKPRSGTTETGHTSNRSRSRETRRRVVMQVAALSSRMLARLAVETREDGLRASIERNAALVPPSLDGYRRFLASIRVFEFAVELELVHVIGGSVDLLQKVFKSGNCNDDLLGLGDVL